MNKEDEIFLACGTDKSNALAWHNNLHSLMLGAYCSLEVSERVLTNTEMLTRLKKAWHKPHQRVHPVLVCQQGL